MPKYSRAAVPTLTALAALLPASALWAQIPVTISTDEGDIVVELDDTRAPVTTANFLRYVDAGLYENGTIYRTVHADNQPDDSVRIAVIQGGVDRERREEAFEPIRMEPTGETGLRHLDGVISMARDGPHTARGEFFITVGDQPELDHGGRRNPDGWGFAAFGKVVQGMDVVRRINRMPAEGQTLTPPVRILGVTRLRPRGLRPGSDADVPGEAESDSCLTLT
jgi:peptidyl-prolyl cis-trans isomerase A (cyclophilin A)